MRTEPQRQDCDESRPPGGQAPDQANSGRQTGAALPPGQIIRKAHNHAANTLTSHEQHDDNHPGDGPRRTATRVSQHPEREIVVIRGTRKLVTQG